MNIDMTNIAYTEEYKEDWAKFDAIFNKDYRKGEETFELEQGYSLMAVSYHGNVNGCNLTATENHLMDSVGREIYRYHSLDDKNVHTILSHSNGRNYFLFCTGLYGYGVFDLKRKKEFFYIPRGPESFIWTGVIYNPANNILIVEGCFWACPYGINLIDFSKPMRETVWVDVQNEINAGYDKYDDINFVRWDDDTLVLIAEVAVNGTQTEELRISKEVYRSWFTTNEKK